MRLERAAAGRALACSCNRARAERRGAARGLRLPFPRSSERQEAKSRRLVSVAGTPTIPPGADWALPDGNSLRPARRRRRRSGRESAVTNAMRIRIPALRARRSSGRRRAQVSDPSPSPTGNAAVRRQGFRMRLFRFEHVAPQLARYRAKRNFSRTAGRAEPSSARAIPACGDSSSRNSVLVACITTFGSN